MNKNRIVRLIVILLIAIALVGGVLFVFSMPPISIGWEFPTTQNALSSVTRMPGCVPLPARTRDLSTPTPTSERTGATASPFQIATVTPIPFAHIYDLDPDVDQDQKSNVVIFRCNGDWDLYLFSPRWDFDQAVSLGPGDIIISTGPPSVLMGIEPPEPTIVRPPIKTNTPYPIP